MKQYGHLNSIFFQSVKYDLNLMRTLNVNLAYAEMINFTYGRRALTLCGNILLKSRKKICICTLHILTAQQDGTLHNWKSRTSSVKTKQNAI